MLSHLAGQIPEFQRDKREKRRKREREEYGRVALELKGCRQEMCISNLQGTETLSAPSNPICNTWKVEPEKEGEETGRLEKEDEVSQRKYSGGVHFISGGPTDFQRKNAPSQTVG